MNVGTGRDGCDYVIRICIHKRCYCSIPEEVSRISVTTQSRCYTTILFTCTASVIQRLKSIELLLSKGINTLVSHSPGALWLELFSCFLRIQRKTDMKTWGVGVNKGSASRRVDESELINHHHLPPRNLPNPSFFSRSRRSSDDFARAPTEFRHDEQFG